MLISFHRLAIPSITHRLYELWRLKFVIIQAVYVEHLPWARSCNHCCHGEAISITYSECVFVALGSQHAYACALLCCHGLSASTIFSSLSRNRHDFTRKVIEHKMCVVIFFYKFAWNISHSKKNWARYDHKCALVFTLSAPYSFQILMKIWIFPDTF
jgi:hypothetical protein